MSHLYILYVNNRFKTYKSRNMSLKRKKVRILVQEQVIDEDKTYWHTSYQTPDFVLSNNIVEEVLRDYTHTIGLTLERFLDSFELKHHK